MNILVTSAGRRVKIIEYFKNSLKLNGGKILAVDCDLHAPSLYFADYYEIVPRIDDPNYINTLIDLCKQYNINAIISLIDPELDLLAHHKSIFDQHQVQLILSPIESIEIAFDKYETYRYLNDKGIPAVPTYNNIEEVKCLIENNSLSYPFVVKPSRGSASIGVDIVTNGNELINSFNQSEGQIIQPFYKDKEFGIDAYIDMVSGELVDLFIKEKISMRSGETDKAKSIHNDKIEDLVKQMIESTNFSGPIDIDCFEYDGNYYISEINPRFGGGYPHAYESGCDFMTYIAENLQNKANSTYESYSYKKDSIMMKFDYIKMIQD